MSTTVDPQLRVRPWLQNIDPYRPGRKAPSAAGALASNESPLPASEHVRAAIAAATAEMRRYPDPLATELRADLAELHDVDPECILVTNGSDESIVLLATAYLARTGRIVCADPAYAIDCLSARVVDAEITQIPLRNWTHDLDAMAPVEADIAYVVNPHNPSGTVCGRSEIANFVADSRQGLVVVDEAYIDLADDPGATTALPLVRGNPRVAVLRTFSKAYGLAGLRVGYLVAAPEVIATLRAIRAPFSVNTLAQHAARAALQDAPHYEATCAYTRTARATLARLLLEAGLEPVPSQANFVLVPVAGEEAFVDLLAAHGIAVRPGRALGAPGTVRISVPDPDGLALVRTALADPALRAIVPARSG